MKKFFAAQTLSAAAPLAPHAAPPATASRPHVHGWDQHLEGSPRQPRHDHPGATCATITREINLTDDQAVTASSDSFQVIDGARVVKAITWKELKFG